MSKNLELIQAMLEQVDTVPQDVLAQAVKLGAMVDACEDIGVTIIFTNVRKLDAAMPIMSGGVTIEQQLPLALNNLLLGAAQRGIAIQFADAGQTESGECNCERCRARRGSAERVVN